jgi:hypothetical protein
MKKLLLASLLAAAVMFGAATTLDDATAPTKKKVSIETAPTKKKVSIETAPTKKKVSIETAPTKKKVSIETTRTKKQSPKILTKSAPKPGSTGGGTGKVADTESAHKSGPGDEGPDAKIVPTTAVGENVTKARCTLVRASLVILRRGSG